MKQKLRKGMIPPRGHHYIQDGTMIKGYSAANIVDKIGQFRIANQIDYGNPQEDYEAYLCSEFPRLCAPSYDEGEAEAMADDTPSQVPALDEVRRWAKLTAYRRSKWGQLETTETAEARSQTCSTCPLHKEIRSLSLCNPCISELDRQSVLLREGRKLNTNPGYCSATFQDNRSAVFLPKAGLERSLERVEETVPECWLRTL